MKLNLIYSSAALLLLLSCSPKVLPPAQQIDSVRVEVHERVVHDTVTFTIEKEIEKNVTSDTISVLENSYALSRAEISEGLLSHSLESKPQKIQKPVIVTVRDTVTIHHQSETKYVSVPAEFTPMQTFFMQLGKILGGLVLVLLLAFIVGLVLKLKRIL